MAWIGKWQGGRIWRDEDGTRTYFIRRQIAGKRYEISTRCTLESAALEQLARFEEDPVGYAPTTTSSASPIYLNLELMLDYLRWCHGRNTEKWIREKRTLLAWWADRLGAKDLRRLSLRDHIAPAIPRGTKGRAHRIQTIKNLFTWLREERHVLSSAEDPTLDLPVPQARPEQWKIPKVIPIADHQAMLGQIEPAWRSHILVLAGTGWHVTELMRFAAGGTVDPLPPSALSVNGASEILMCPKRKSGEIQRTAVSADVATAGRMVLAASPFRPKNFSRAIAKACSRAKVAMIHPGCYRHSVATWALEQGSTPEAAAGFLGLKSVSTLRRFYATLAVVPKIHTLA